MYLGSLKSAFRIEKPADNATFITELYSSRPLKITIHYITYLSPHTPTASPKIHPSPPFYKDKYKMYTRRYTQCRQTIRTTVYKGSSRDYQLSTYTETWNKRWHRYYVSYFCTFEMTLKSFSHFVLYHLFSD